MSDSNCDPEPKSRSGRWANHTPRPIITCAVCDKKFSVRPSRADKAKYCCYECHQIGEGRKGGAVRGEQVKALSEGKAYKKTKQRHTHRVVAEQKIGRLLLPGEVVHHIDGNKLNNDPSNLEVLSSQAEHARLHSINFWKGRKEFNESN